MPTFWVKGSAPGSDGVKILTMPFFSLSDEPIRCVMQARSVIADVPAAVTCRAHFLNEIFGRAFAVLDHSRHAKGILEKRHAIESLRLNDARFGVFGTSSVKPTYGVPFNSIAIFPNHFADGQLVPAFRGPISPRFD